MKVKSDGLTPGQVISGFEVLPGSIFSLSVLHICSVTKMIPHDILDLTAGTFSSLKCCYCCWPWDMDLNISIFLNPVGVYKRIIASLVSLKVTKGRIHILCGIILNKE